jgi:hypothetical protein
VTVTIPTNIELGTHTITVKTPDGAISKSITIQVANAATTTSVVAAAAAAAAAPSTVAASVLGTQTTNSTVAFTGANAQRWAVIGAFCLLLGILLWANARPIKPLKQPNS